MMRPRRRVLVAIALPIALLALGGFLLRAWQGPRLPGYQIRAQPLVQTVVATGRVVAVSRAQVGSQITGVVVERRVREGDRVQPGDVLAVLRADDLAAGVREAEAAVAQLRQSSRPQARADLARAQALLEQARRETQRRRELFRQQLIARETLEQAVQAETVARTAAEQARLAAESLAAGHPDDVLVRERLAAARAALAKTTIRAEVAGTVLTRNAEPGDVVQPGTVLFEIARDGDTEVLVPLDEKNLEVVALGQPAQCVADAYPARPFPAAVSFIAPRVDPQRGTVEVRLQVTPVPAFLRQDMTVSVNVRTGTRAKALVVPNDALANVGGDRAELWAVRGGKARRIRVQLGLRGVALSEVTDGLSPGDWVLADPGADLDDGDRVRVSSEALPATAQDPSVRNELPVQLD